MDYSEFEVDDFLKDENFVLWVKEPSQDRSFFWNTWISNHPDRLETLLRAKELIMAVAPRNKPTPSEQEFLSILEKVMKNDSRNYTTTRQRRLVKIKRRVIQWSVAASLLVGLFLGISPLIDDPLSLGSKTENTMATITKVTLPGQKLTKHTLPDGTIISLNADSKLSYPEKFGEDRREVFLEGEAFFDVKRNEQKPFLINTQGSVTKVLGTSFNINAYPGENNIEIAVRSGKVAVFPWPNEDTEERQEMLLLNPNEKAIVRPVTHQVSKNAADIETITSWKENLLIFQNDPFEVVVKKLERWYGVKFNIDTQTIPKGKWNGHFQGSSLQYVLKGLMFSSDYQFTIDHTNVYVTDKK